MAFQMGIAGLLKFHTTLARIRRGDYYGASTSMLSSLWASQTPTRAARLSTAMHTGDPSDL
jgi:lysozyme